MFMQAPLDPQVLRCWMGWSNKVFRLVSADSPISTARVRYDGKKMSMSCGCDWNQNINNRRTEGGTNYGAFPQLWPLFFNKSKHCKQILRKVEWLKGYACIWVTWCSQASGWRWAWQERQEWHWKYHSMWSSSPFYSTVQYYLLDVVMSSHCLSLCPTAEGNRKNLAHGCCFLAACLCNM